MISKRSTKLKSDKPSYTKKEKSDSGGTIYRYDDKHIRKRWELKKKQLKKLEKDIKKVRDKYRSDLSSDDERTRAIAAIVGIMDDTAMRIGNEESAKEGTYGATTLKVKHVKGGPGNMTFDFPGKGAIEQNVVLKNNQVIKVVRDLMKGKKKDDFIFEVEGKKIWDRAVNRYLKEFDISAKDLRGFHANRLMKEQLKKKDFKDALKEVAEIVGHEEATLKNQYLDPELVEKHEKKSDEKKKSAALSTRAYEQVEQKDIGGPELETVPAEEYRDEVDKPIMSLPGDNPVDLNLNVSNISDRSKINPLVAIAWKILAPFLPPGAELSSGFRSEMDQANTIRRFWFKKWNGYFYKNYRDKANSVRDMWHFMTVEYPKIKKDDRKPGGPDKVSIALPGKSKHQSGKAMDIHKIRNYNNAAMTIRWLNKVLPEYVNFVPINEGKDQDAIHVKINKAIYPGPANMERALRMKRDRVDLPKMYVSQDYKPILSKRAYTDDKIDVLYIVHPDSIVEKSFDTNYVGSYLSKVSSAVSSHDGPVIITSLDRMTDFGGNDAKRIVKSFVSDMGGRSNVTMIKEDQGNSSTLGLLAGEKLLDDLYLRGSLGTIRVGGCFTGSWCRMCVDDTVKQLVKQYGSEHVVLDNSFTCAAGNDIAEEKEPESTTDASFVSRVLSKRAELTEEDKKWVESVKPSISRRTPGTTPFSGATEHEILDIDQDIRKQLRLGKNTKLSPNVLAAWMSIKPFLDMNPSTQHVRVTSGSRNADDQKRILRNYWKKNTGQDIPKHLWNDNRMWKQVSVLLKRHYGLIVGPPVYNPKVKYSHGRGNAFDVSGGNLYAIKDVVNMVSRDSRIPVKLRALVEENNNAVHISVISAKYDENAIVNVLKDSGYRVASISKRADSSDDINICDVYEDLITSNPPESVLLDFENAFGMSKCAGDSWFDEMGLGIDDMPGDWFEKSPIFRWDEEDEHDFERDDIKESEAKELAKDDPEQFFYRGLHKEFPDLEAEALENIIDNNPKFFFVFKYHECEDEDLEDLIEKAAEGLALQDPRAFFYYHLHHKYPELGRGAIVHLVDKDPRSFGQLGLAKDYPDYEQAASDAINIYDPTKVDVREMEEKTASISKRADGTVKLGPDYKEEHGLVDNTNKDPEFLKRKKEEFEKMQEYLKFRETYKHLLEEADRDRGKDIDEKRRNFWKHQLSLRDIGTRPHFWEYPVDEEKRREEETKKEYEKKIKDMKPEVDDDERLLRYLEVRKKYQPLFDKIREEEKRKISRR